MRFNQKKILIIEDDRVAREIENKALLDAGYDAFKSESSLQAFEILERHEIDLIILDLNLPNVRGDHFLKILRNRTNMQTIPVVVCSASGHRIDVIRCIKYGISDYIIKPFILKEFLKRIENAIKGVPFILKDNREVIGDKDYNHVLSDEMDLQKLTKNSMDEDATKLKIEDELNDDELNDEHIDEQSNNEEIIDIAQ